MIFTGDKGDAMAQAGIAKLRGYQPEDAVFIRSLVAEQGWNAGIHDVETFTEVDPDAWIVAEIGEQPVGIVLATRWSESHGWIGLYLVRAEFRGRGIGLELFRAALARLAPRSVGLDGDARQQANYRRSGFVNVHANTRWRGPARMWRARTDAAEVVDARSLPVEPLVDLDARAVGTPRPRLVRAWLAQPEASHVALLRDGDVTGLATARPARSGWKIGPLYAPDASGAAALLAAVTRDLNPDDEWWLDTPNPNAAAMALMENNGAIAVPTSGRMVRGQGPVGDTSVMFALLAHEVG
jgi:GNAT superfamily N-acetyltransferase